MPAKLSTISYIHEVTERITQDFTVKEITAVSRLSDDDPTKVIYLKIKAFIPLELHQLESFILWKDIQTKDKPPGQAYVALSRCSTCDNVEISHLDRSAFMTDPDVILEYQRLTTISTSNPHIFSWLLYFLFNFYN
jgi:hypothetical protein